MAKSLKRKIIDFSREEEELLINLIKERSAIYDPKDENYKNGQYRSLQWIEISDIMNKSGKLKHLSTAPYKNRNKLDQVNFSNKVETPRIVKSWKRL